MIDFFRCKYDVMDQNGSMMVGGWSDYDDVYMFPFLSSHQAASLDRHNLSECACKRTQYYYHIITLIQSIEKKNKIHVHVLLEIASCSLPEKNGINIILTDFISEYQALKSLLQSKYWCVFESKVWIIYAKINIYPLLY